MLRTAGLFWLLLASDIDPVAGKDCLLRKIYVDLPWLP